ncbi:MAG: energy-coupling factor transporter transmembrane protein EcfT [Bifidobacteriaceae bacterium]|nr:energy-coupling factor transporter transmembrane protein EcfT [Bifidobacteriaceae bacterium]
MSAAAGAASSNGGGAGRPAAPLAQINPLAKLVATLPLMVAVLLTRDPWTPAATLALAALVVVLGGGLPARTLLLGALALTAAAAWLGLVFAFLARPGMAPDSGALVIGSAGVAGGPWVVGAATALRLTAAMTLALAGSLGTTVASLTSALVRHWRVPYRFADGAGQALRFAPRYAREVQTLRAAQRARGIGQRRGPVGAVRRSARMVLPLVAGGVRHAERVALAMDSRAFGAFERRTDRAPTQMRARDFVFVAALWGAYAAIVATGIAAGTFDGASNMNSI